MHCQSPSSLTLQSDVFLSYKNTTTFKGLTGIAPCGAVIFVSSLYTGSISDRELPELCGTQGAGRWLHVRQRISPLRRCWLTAGQSCSYPTLNHSTIQQRRCSENTSHSSASNSCWKSNQRSERVSYMRRHYSSNFVWDSQPAVDQLLLDDQLSGTTWFERPHTGCIEYGCVIVNVVATNKLSFWQWWNLTKYIYSSTVLEFSFDILVLDMFIKKR